MKIDFNKALAVLDVLPGQKRTVTMFFALGMLICQFGEWHMFTNAQWIEVGVAYGLFKHMDDVRTPTARLKETK